MPHARKSLLTAYRSALVAMLAALCLSLAACGKQPAADAPAPALIPAPAKMTLHAGSYVLTPDSTWVAADEASARVARYFSALTARTHKLVLKSASGENGAIVFAIDKNATDAVEGYTLRITDQGVRVAARDERGLFYGAVTLWQLLRADGRLPRVDIEDAPRFAWRGLMLDSARHFQSVDDIKKLLDALALHKLNTFHWHLTDDQSWRIEIMKYPRLAKVGGCRIPAGDGGIDPATGKPRPYCGYYTQEQIRDVVRYAAERHIAVVPEIDVPGHAQAAIAAYPELGVLGTRPPVSNEWGVHTYLFNVEEGTFRFLEDVLDEVTTLFPGAYVHVGGDEAVKDQWQASPRVQQRMRELGAKDEAQMQSQLLKRLEEHLASRGRHLIGWDEILEGGLPPAATVMSWRGTQGGIDAARLGHDVVMSPSSDLYLDYLQTDSANEPPGRPATITLQQVYAYEPVPSALTGDEKKHVLGLQANVWTEHMRTFARVQHAVFPRIAALAEIAWSPASSKDYKNFLARLPSQLQRYRALGIDYAGTPFEVGITTDAGGQAGTADVALTNPLGYGIRYTIDGSEPTAASAEYRAPFAVPLPAQVRAAAFFNDRPLAAATTRRIDAASLLVRSDEQLKMCTDSLMLRLEDDGPADGERAIYDVDIFNPCWQWDDAALDGIAAIRVHAGRIPYFFQLAHDESHRRFKPARTAHGELEIHAGCDGELLASAPLPARPGADGFVTLDAKLAGPAGKQDLCMFFTGDTRPTMWTVDAVKLIPR
jgi:hexosaminidase